MGQDNLPSNATSPDECIRSLCIREGDVQQRNFFKYRDTVREVYRELNLYAIRYTERYLLPVDKNTNSIILPKKYLLLSSISYINDCNRIIPLTINTNLHQDIIDISLDKNCYCECECKSSLCGVIKNYEAIKEDTVEQMPNNSYKTFTSITRKTAYPDGSLYMERTYPVKVYANGVFTDVRLTTDKELLCKLETKKCGCIVDNEENKKKIGECCNAETYTWDWGCTLCDFESPLTYNFTELGDRIMFPSSCAFDKALVRFYPENKIKDMRIPLLAKPAFMAGMRAKVAEYEDLPEYKIRRFISSYNTKTEKLSIDLNKYTLHEYYKVFTPKRIMP